MNNLAMAPVAAFDAIAGRYDEIFTNSLIGRAQRNAVWRELEQLFPSGSSVLELNCGTGEDALFLAARGVVVTALDQSPRMIDVAERRLAAHPGAKVSFCPLDNEDLAVLRPRRFDGAFSNFGGLNCIRDLGGVAENLGALLKPGAPLLLCLLGPCCAWEVLWYALRGQWKKAFRRFGYRPVTARIADGPPLAVRYRTVRALEAVFSPYFRLKSWQGVGILVPPSYAETWARRFPRLLRFSAWLDSYLGRCPGIRGAADHIVLSLERL